MGNLRLFFLLTVTILLCFPFPSAAQLAISSTRETGLAAAGVALANGSDSRINPATTYAEGYGSVWVQSDFPFLIQGLQIHSAGAGFRVKRIALSIAVSGGGFANYTSVSVGTRVAVATSSSAVVPWTAGFRVWLTKTGIPGYSVPVQAVVEAGWCVEISPSFSAGSRFSFETSTIPDQPTIGPRQILLGTAFRPVKNLILVADIDKRLGFPTSTALGAELSPVGMLAIRLGVSTVPLSLAGGFGLKLESLQVDAAVKTHGVLGPTPSVSVKWNIGAR